MYSESIRAQFIKQNNDSYRTVSTRIASHFNDIKQVYASFIDQLLWTEVTDVRQFSSKLKKELNPTTSPTALLTKPLSFIRLECSTFKKTSFFKFLKEKIFTHHKEKIDPNFNRAEAIEEEKERRAELNILSAIPVEDLTDEQLKINKRFTEYYTDPISFSFIQDAWLGSDGKVYDYETLIHLNGIDPITKKPLFAVPDNRFTKELNWYLKTGLAPNILLDPFTNKVMQNPVFTTSGIRCDSSNVKLIKYNFVLQKDFTTRQFLGSLNAVDAQSINNFNSKSFSEYALIIRSKSCSEKQKNILDLSERQQFALHLNLNRSYRSEEQIELQGPQEIANQMIELAISNSFNFSLSQMLLTAIAMEVRISRVESKSNEKKYVMDSRVLENKIFHLQDIEQLREEVKFRKNKINERISALECNNNKSYFSRLIG